MRIIGGRCSRLAALPLMLLFTSAPSGQTRPWVVAVDQAQKTDEFGMYSLLGPQPQLALWFWVGYDEETRANGLDWFRERMRVDVQRNGSSIAVHLPTLQDGWYNSSDETVRLRVDIKRADGLPFIPGEYRITIDLSPILALVKSGDRLLRSGLPAQQAARVRIQEVVTREQQIEFHNREGSRHRRDGDTTAAIRHFQESLRVEPDQFQALSALGVLYVHLKRYRDAIPLLERALPWYLKLRERRGGVPELLAAAYLAIGRDADAVRVLRSVGYTDAAIAERVERLRLERRQ
jgi:tetratricopeptide (TPR) repeat protein